MAQETETAPASPDQPTTATVTAPAAPVVDSQLTVPETASPQATKPVNVFKRYSADELAEIREGFAAKVHNGHKIVGEIATTATPAPKGDTLPIEDNPTETITEPEKKDTPEVKAEPTGKDPTPTDAPELDPETGEPIEPAPTPGRTPQQRLRAANPLDDMALTIYRKATAAGKPISLSQAEAKAREILGDTEAALPEVKVVDALRTELAGLRTKRKEAKAAFDDDAFETAQSAIEDKLLEIDRAERDEVFRQQHEQAQAQNIIASAQSEAVRLYPDLKLDGKQGRAESEMHKAAREIHRQLLEQGDPAVNEPDYHLDLARRAAKVTSTPPSTAAKPAAPKTVSRTVTQPAKPPLAPLTSGSARTSPTSQATNLKVGIQKASPRQLEALVDNVRAVLERRR